MLFVSTIFNAAGGWLTIVTSVSNFALNAPLRRAGLLVRLRRNRLGWSGRNRFRDEVWEFGQNFKPMPEWRLDWATAGLQVIQVRKTGRNRMRIVSSSLPGDYFQHRPLSRYSYA